MCMLWMARYFNRESRKNEEPEKAAPTTSLDVSTQTQQDFSVRIIHAGGLVERYQGTIHAGRVMEKYPNMCIARPEVFKKPHESLVRPDEFLLPGQKFYLVPSTTVKKLKRKHKQREELGGVEAERRERSPDKKLVDHVEESDDDSDLDSGFSAKDFYVSGRSWPRYVLSYGKKEKKPFTPPIKKVSMWQQGIGWQPSLDSVEELSP